jgi:Lrp/AsnC family transcriptional regulator, regulator for asnA, asnC and gidA
MIDKTDLRIINALAKNARLSNARIASQLNIAASTVTRRIDSLLTNNIVSIKALPNPSKIGYKASAVIGLDVDFKKVDGVCQKLTENNQITLVVTIFGRFDVLIIADFPDHEMMNNFIKQELPKIDGITRIEPFFVSETTKRYSGMFSSKGKTNTYPAIDAIDRELLNVLGKNGRASYSQLAEEFGISIATISRRVRAMIKDDLIKITVVPNPAKFGYLAIAGTVLHIDFIKVNEIAAKLAARPEVHTVMKLANSYDIFFIVHFPTPEKLYQYLKTQIANLDGVLNIETFVVSDVVKLSTTALGLNLENLD